MAAASRERGARYAREGLRLAPVVDGPQPAEPPDARTRVAIPAAFVIVTPIKNFQQYRAWPRRPPPGHPA